MIVNDKHEVVMNLKSFSPEKNLRSGQYPRMMRHLTLSAIMILLTVSTFAQSPEVRKALRHFEIEQPKKGMAALEALPQNSTNFYYLGLAQLRSGQKDQALANFEKGIAANEKDGLNYAGKGHVRLLEKNPTDAKVQLDKALSVSRSKDVNVLKAVAEAYLTDTKYLLDAINVLNKAAGINSTDPEVQMLLGDASLMQNQQNAGPAVNAYEKAARADNKIAKPHFKIGKIWQRAKSLDNAIASYEKAISIDPEYAPAYKELGQIYYLQKQAAKAVEVYEKYMAITENPGDAKFQQAFFYFMAKNYEKANAIFREVTTNQNVAPVAFKFYALSLIEQQKLDEATKMFEQYFAKAKPENLVADDYAEYGKLKLLLKTPEGDSLANEYFAKSIDLDSAQTDILQLHGDTFLKRKKFDEAIVAFKQLMSLRQQPLSQDLWSIGRAYYYNEQFVEADSAFTQLAEKQPNMTVGFQFAARARRQIDSTGVQALANPMFEQLVEKALANPDKYKKELIEAYEYFGSYYVNVKLDIPKAKSYFEKILQLDPAHAQAKEALKVINAPPPSNKGGK
jgi:tetratricopeptide (TPR) repeat protein